MRTTDSAAVAAAADGEVGEALVVDALGDDEEECELGGGSASLPPHAETAANISVPVAQEINPSRIFIALVLLPLAIRLEAQPTPAGGACIV
jgi:hypothetical protein